MELVVILAAIALFFIFHEQSVKQKFLEEQQAKRDQQILEWDAQLRMYPFLRDIYEGRITQADIDAANARKPEPEEPPNTHWDKEGF